MTKDTFKLSEAVGLPVDQMEHIHNSIDELCDESSDTETFVKESAKLASRSESRLV